MAAATIELGDKSLENDSMINDLKIETKRCTALSILRGTWGVRSTIMVPIWYYSTIVFSIRKSKVTDRKVLLNDPSNDSEAIENDS